LDNRFYLKWSTGRKKARLILQPGSKLGCA
jgi:hypothetical protein